MTLCRVCGSMKYLSEFYPQQVRKCGEVGECKECTKVRVKDNRNRRIQYYREYDAARYQSDPSVRRRHRRYSKTPEGRMALQRSREKWLRENPKKRAAQVAVNNAVRDGRLKKPCTCSACGDGGRIEGHHEDYSKPLVVKWLCRSCHVARHRELEAAE